MNSKQIKAILIFIGLPVLLAVLWILARYYGFIESGFEGIETIQSTPIVKPPGNN